MKYRKSVWYDQATTAYAVYWEGERTKGAGRIADEIRANEDYVIRDYFQRDRYTWVELIHRRSGISYTATGWTWHSPPDIYSAEFGRSEAILRALRKIAKQLVWERDCHKILQELERKMVQAQANYNFHLRAFRQMESDRIHKHDGLHLG